MRTYKFMLIALCAACLASATASDEGTTDGIPHGTLAGVSLGAQYTIILYVSANGHEATCNTAEVRCPLWLPALSML